MDVHIILEHLRFSFFCFTTDSVEEGEKLVRTALENFGRIGKSGLNSIKHSEVIYSFEHITEYFSWNKVLMHSDVNHQVREEIFTCVSERTVVTLTCMF